MSDSAELGLVIWTTDIPAFVTMLEQAGQLRCVARHPGYAELETGSGRIVLHSDDDAYRGHPWYDAVRKEGAARGIGAEIRLRVPDVDGAYAQALKLGAQAVQQPADVGDSYECQVMVIDGFLLSFWEAPRVATAAQAPSAARAGIGWPTRPSSLRRP